MKRFKSTKMAERSRGSDSGTFHQKFALPLCALKTVVHSL